MVARRPASFQSHLIEGEFFICCWMLTTLPLSVSRMSREHKRRKEDGRNVCEDLSKRRDRGQEIYDGNYDLENGAKCAFQKMKRY